MIGFYQSDIYRVFRQRFVWLPSRLLMGGFRTRRFVPFVSKIFGESGANSGIGNLAIGTVKRKGLNAKIKGNLSLPCVPASTSGHSSRTA
jgi:hypothetical protein